MKRFFLKDLVNQAFAKIATAEKDPYAVYIVKKNQLGSIRRRTTSYRRSSLSGASSGYAIVFNGLSSPSKIL